MPSKSPALPKWAFAQRRPRALVQSTGGERLRLHARPFVITFELADADATTRLGARLADTLPERAVVLLRGNLGAGKTTLARALLQRLGVTGAVRSPTYTLIERYGTPAGEAVHLDLYRIADPEELFYLGLDDLHASTRLWLVEWPERGRGALPSADLELHLGVAGTGRRAELRPLSAAGVAWVHSLADNPPLAAQSPCAT